MAALILSTIESQVVNWTKQGISSTEILQRIQQEYPSLSIQQLTAVQVFLGISPTDPLFQLHELQHQRQHLLEKLNKRLEAEDAPVSVFNLYRGILRDQEACLWKLAAQEVKPVAKAPVPAPVPAPEAKQQPKRAGCISTMILVVLLMIGLACGWLVRFLPPAHHRTGLPTAIHQEEISSFRMVHGSAGASPSHDTIFLHDTTEHPWKHQPPPPTSPRAASSSSH
jgi:hypothetical protein